MRQPGPILASALTRANYEFMPSLTVSQIAALCDGQAEGDLHHLITGANALEDAEGHDLSFVAGAKAAQQAAASGAGCLLVSQDFSHAGKKTLVRVEDPRASFAQALAVLYAVPRPAASLHPSALIDPTARLGADVTVGAYVTVGAGTQIEDGCTIGNGCAIGDNVHIAAGTVLHPNVTVYWGVQIGRRVVVHAGCVLGADGFGFARVGNTYRKFPQVGTVVIEDDVELGANTCVDRASLGRTVIGAGTKIDNLVQVAHNVKIGRNVVIAAQTGLSGGVMVGDNAMVGGQVGVADKARIDENAIIGAQSGITTKAHVRAGEPVWGTPARPIKQYLKGLAQVNRLGQHTTEWKALKEEVDRLREQLLQRP